MSLLPLDAWAEVFEPWRGKRAQYMPAPGNNPGDRLIDAAALQLMAHFGVLDAGEPEVFLCAGGGNLGTRWWPECAAERARVLHQAAGRPVVVLPQTYTGGDESRGYAAVWVREPISLATWPGSRFAPDLALAYTPASPLPAAIVAEGVFLRHDCKPEPWAASDLGDPVALASTAAEYVLAASRFERIVTNRLHFAIAGMIAGRQVRLIAGPYWKNRAVWEQSLAALGCEWA